METVGSTTMFSFLDGDRDARSVRNAQVRHGRGCLVNSYLDLAKKVAELQFRNRDLVLLFRGQPADHLNGQRNSTLKASLLRSTPGSSAPPAMDVLAQRFSKLRRAEERLVT